MTQTMVYTDRLGLWHWAPGQHLGAFVAIQFFFFFSTLQSAISYDWALLYNKVTRYMQHDYSSWQFWTRSRNETEMPKVSTWLGMGGKNKLESGRTRGVRLGVQHNSAHSLQLFLLMGQIIYRKRINHLMKTMQSVCWAQNPWLERQQWLFSLGPYSHHVLVSNTDTHTPLSETTDPTGAAKTDVEKLALWLGWQLHLQGQGRNGDSTSLLNPCI